MTVAQFLILMKASLVMDLEFPKTGLMTMDLDLVPHCQEVVFFVNYIRRMHVYTILCTSQDTQS